MTGAGHGDGAEDETLAELRRRAEAVEAALARQREAAQLRAVDAALDATEGSSGFWARVRRVFWSDGSSGGAR